MTSKKEEIIMSTSMAVIKIEARIRIRRFLFFGKKGEV
jgi:TnpA family transposase